MSYVITWWEGEVRRNIDRTTEELAQATALALRKRSDAYTDRSLVPIRVMTHSAYKHMQELAKAGDTTQCRHGYLRACVRCLSSIIA